MKIYEISGLGADKRVFDFLQLECELVPIEWIEPLRNESIEKYAERLSKVIDTTEAFGVLGVSFGGLVAVEVSKILNPKITILISSAETRHEVRSLYMLIGKLGIVKLIPVSCFNLPMWFSNCVFGAKNKKILNAILKDTDLRFAKWAINQLLTWGNQTNIENMIKICGSSDKLMPPSKDEKAIIIEKGEHFMIVDKAIEISRVINQCLSYRY